MSKEVTIVETALQRLFPQARSYLGRATYSVAQSLGNSVTLRDLNGLYRVGEKS